jgi:hypothetical protein
MEPTPVLYSPDDLSAWLAGERHHHVVKAETLYRMRLDDGSWSAWYKYTADEWAAFTAEADDTFESEARVVSVVPPALETVECPTCGKGELGRHLSGGEVIRCWWAGSHCDGKGRVTVLAVGAEQWGDGKPLGRSDTTDPDEMAEEEAAIRQFGRTVVAYQLVGVEKLPVVGYDAKRVMPPCVVEIRTIERTLFDLVAADGTEHNVGFEAVPNSEATP